MGLINNFLYFRS